MNIPQAVLWPHSAALVCSPLVGLGADADVCFCSRYACPFSSSDGGGTLLGRSRSPTSTEKEKVHQLYSADIVQRVEAITPEHQVVQAILEEFPAKRPVSVTRSHATYLIAAPGT
eukprot:COSAG02_NODE_2853_length_7891_cov_7.789913_5_plen_115_part_00